MCRVYNFIIRVKTIYILSLMGQTGSQTSLDNPGPCVAFSITQIIDFSYTRHFVGAHGWVPVSQNNHNHNILCIDLEREISCHRRTAINNGGRPTKPAPLNSLHSSKSCLMSLECGLSWSATLRRYLRPLSKDTPALFSEQKRLLRWLLTENANHISGPVTKYSGIITLHQRLILTAFLLRVEVINKLCRPGYWATNNNQQ